VIFSYLSPALTNETIKLIGKVPEVHYVRHSNLFYFLDRFGSNILQRDHIVPQEEYGVNFLSNPPNVIDSSVWAFMSYFFATFRNSYQFASLRFPGVVANILLMTNF
jgi:hypothetical protein